MSSQLLPALTLALAALLLPASAAAEPLVEYNDGRQTLGVAAGTGCNGVESTVHWPWFHYTCYGVYVLPNGFVCIGTFHYDDYRATCSSALPVLPLDGQSASTASGPLTVEPVWLPLAL